MIYSVNAKKKRIAYKAMQNDELESKGCTPVEKFFIKFLTTLGLPMVIAILLFIVFCNTYSSAAFLAVSILAVITCAFNFIGYGCYKKYHTAHFNTLHTEEFAVNGSNYIYSFTEKSNELNGQISFRPVFYRNFIYFSKDELMQAEIKLLPYGVAINGKFTFKQEIVKNFNNDNPKPYTAGIVDGLIILDCFDGLNLNDIFKS